MRLTSIYVRFCELSLVATLSFTTCLPCLAGSVPLTPQACTEVRYLAPDDFNSRASLALSPNGNAIAYVIQKPNIPANENNDALYVAPLNPPSNATLREVVVNKRIAAIQWFSDNRHLAALIEQDGMTILVRIDSQTSSTTTILRADSDITDYSMSADGNTIAVGVRQINKNDASINEEKRTHDGYRVELQSTAQPARPRRNILILKSTEGHWNIDQRVEFRSPLSGLSMTSVVDSHWMHIRMSPDGRYLLIDNIEEFSEISLPEQWQRSLVVKYQEARVEGIGVIYLYNLESKAASLPIQSPELIDATWSPDSQSLAVVALPPVRSRWETEDMEKSKPNDHLYHLFTINIGTGTLAEVLNRSEVAPLLWTQQGSLIVRDETGTVRTFKQRSEQWVLENSFRIPLKRLAPASSLVTDGVRFVGEYETAEIPPQIYEYLPPSSDVRVISDLDPEMKGFLLPRAEDVTWTTSTGYPARGVVLLPPDYDPHRRYPLVIEDGSILYSGEFACDSGPAHVSSFARGILADAGVIYLMRSSPGIIGSWENNFYPEGYPGGIAEAVFRMDLVESAVRHLAERGMIDSTKVGLVGFSRGGWYTEFALARSKIRFAAAIVTDNVQYSLGEYWYLHDPYTLSGHEAMFGGPPSGKTLRNWLDYSISFNLDKIHTPLLLEVMGHSGVSNDPQRALRNLAVYQEVFVGLRQLRDPVELYFYPNAAHQIDDPATRLIALQRDIDWLRFWLQGNEIATAMNPDYFLRWGFTCSEPNGGPGSRTARVSDSTNLPCISGPVNAGLTANASGKTSDAK